MFSTMRKAMLAMGLVSLSAASVLAAPAPAARSHVTHSRKVAAADSTAATPDTKPAAAGDKKVSKKSTMAKGSKKHDKKATGTPAPAATPDAPK